MAKAKDKGGRPIATLSEDEKVQVEALAAVMSKQMIADYFGIARNTFDAIMAREPDVFERYKKGKAKAIGAVAQGLIEQARSGNTTAAIFYLKTQAGWRETHRIDHSNEDGSLSPKSIDVSKLTDEQLGQLDKIATAIESESD